MDLKVKLYHVHGLPIIEGEECTVALSGRGISITSANYKNELSFQDIATFEFDGTDVLQEDGIIGLVSVMAGGLIGKLEGEKFLSWAAPAGSQYPEEITCLIINFRDNDGAIKQCVFAEKPDAKGKETIIELVFAYDDVRPKPTNIEEILQKGLPLKK
ncbi:hypothetical protein SDC9_32759 [bioreactor metagenome]|uniref:Uncharacterized protein n=1 Tax=bioreactor metagenome TaxID=1076179 RepID=A0A644V7M0_9ZZZZ|nr:hypothetical protein [Acidaminococcaceae bacterium]